jgi:hypothetical protein
MERVPNRVPDLSLLVVLLYVLFVASCILPFDKSFYTPGTAGIAISGLLWLITFAMACFNLVSGKRKTLTICMMVICVISAFLVAFIGPFAGGAI